MRANYIELMDDVDDPDWKWFFCPLCEKKFASASVLENHIGSARHIKCVEWERQVQNASVGTVGGDARAGVSTGWICPLTGVTAYGELHCLLCKQFCTFRVASR